MSIEFVEELKAKIEEVTGRKNSEFKPNDLEIFQKPMCLVRSEGNNVMKIEDKTVEQIEKIEWSIVAVSIVGLGRSGKSYLMNRLAKSSRGFEMGSTMDPVTKGIWVWCRIHPEKVNTVLMLIDTEGLGDVNKGAHSNDNRTFILATLLCNCLIYNINAAFNRDVVSKLTFVTQVAEQIRFRKHSSEGNSSLKLVLPEFFLCLRNCDLELILNGKSVTADEYLEHCLTIEEGTENQFDEPETTECIRKYFSVRKCFSFPTPGVTKNLDKEDFSALSEEFNYAIDTFVSYVYSRPPMTLLASKPVNGRMFTALATHYVQAIQDNGVPNIDVAFTAAAKIENSRITMEAVEIFESQMKMIELPVPSKELQLFFTKAQLTALKHLRKNVVHDIEGDSEFMAEVQMNNFWCALREDNINKIQRMCTATLEHIYDESVEKQITKKSYEVAGGYQKFQLDMEKMKDIFFKRLQEYGEHEILSAWLQFYKTMEETETRIIKYDVALKEKAKQDERRQNYIKSLHEKHSKRKLEALSGELEMLRGHFSELETDRNEHIIYVERLTEEMVKLRNEKGLLERELHIIRVRLQERKKKWFGSRIWNALVKNY